MQASGPPDLCQELLSYAEEKVAAPTDAAAGRKSGPAAVSPPRADGQATGTDDDALFKLAGGTTLQQVRDAARTGDRQTCRDITQALRRAGADLPAWLIALAA